ncbi:MAG: sulfate ABC transporter substrate-binding protein [Rhodobacteraceae bacterium]|nr:sulfate ABC transporter substrate-binding protein [Paracoccaceae bacterium]
MIRILALVAMVWGASASGDTLRLAVTTSFHNSGLSDVLLPAIKADTGLEVHLLVVGTGQALRLGQAGDVDAILVHSRTAEEAFVADGHATHRREIMYNDFVLIGPQDDPAAVQSTASAADAVARIATTESAFVSRGDESGTHKKEISLWLAASLDPQSFKNWYKPVGAGMGASLNTAAGLDAYILSDRASWLNFGNKATLAMLFSGDPALFNQYAYLPVNPDRHPHVNAQAAQTLEVWLTGSRAEQLINGYEIGTEKPFHFNARNPAVDP